MDVAAVLWPAWLDQRHHFLKLACIHDGQYSIVHRALDQRTGNRVALKSIMCKDESEAKLNQIVN